jgi:DNA polymerase-1
MTDYAIIDVNDAAPLDSLSDWLYHRRGEVLAIDCETNAVDPFDPRFHLRTVQISDAHRSWVVAIEECGRSARDYVADLIARHPKFCAHFSEADIRFLARGLPGAVRLDDDEPHIMDTQPVLGLYDPRTVTSQDEAYGAIPLPKGLKPASARYLGDNALVDAERDRDALFAELAPKGLRRNDDVTAHGFATVDVHHPVFQRYAGLDPIMTRRLWDLMVGELARRGQQTVLRRDLALQWHIDRMTLTGMASDSAYAVWLDGELQRVTDDYTDFLWSYGIGPSGMGPVVGETFTALGAISPKSSRKSGQPSWDKTVIQGLTRDPDPFVAELAQILQAVRRAGKFRVAYVAPMLAAIERDGAVHPSMRAYGTITGRQSAANPPDQQLPKRDTRVRSGRIARPGHVLISCDLSQGEPRTMAGLSGDKQLLADILSGDLNSAITSAVFGDVYDPEQGQEADTPHYLMRQGGKRAFLSWCYGAGEPTVRHSLIMDFEGAPWPAPEITESPVAGWLNRWPDLGRLRDTLNAQRYVVLESGRVCPLWDAHFIDEHGVIRYTGRPSRKGLNYATQGTQRELLANAVFAFVERGWSWSLRMLVHDEILIEVPEWMAERAARELQECMTMTYRGVPLVAEAKICGRTWTKRPESWAAFDMSVVDGLDDVESGVA